MKRDWLVAGVLIAVIAGGCARPAASPAAAPNAAALIVDVQGETALKRQGWRDYAPAAFGAALRRGDLLRATGDSRAVVVCSDLHLVEITAGVQGYPCQTEGAAPIVYAGALVNPTRGDPITGEYPVILTPRQTQLREERPLLRWTPVAGATGYRVRLTGTDWETTVADTELRYPADAPALQRGVTYRLVVEASGRSSNEEGSAGAGFTLVSAADAAQVDAEAARVRGLGLGALATDLLLANMLAGRGLHAEAILLLEASAAGEEAALVRLLGDLYLATGLSRAAEESYGVALRLAQDRGDLEGEALAAAGLSRVYDLLGNPQEAAAQRAAALAAYGKLGDEQAAAALRSPATR